MLNLEVFKTGGQNDNKAFKHTTCNRYFLSIGASVQRKLNYQRFFTVDRVYRSMLGPFKTSELTLADSDNQELIWITGFKSVVVAEDGENHFSHEFMCHSNFKV